MQVCILSIYLPILNSNFSIYFSGNVAVVYSVVHHHQTFKNLTNLRIRTNIPKEKSNEESDSSVTAPWIPTNEWVSN